MLVSTICWAKAAKNEIASPCDAALARNAVCEAAGNRALEIMHQRDVNGFIVMEEVRTGAVVTFAVTDRAIADATSLVLPLSVVKLLLAACWWDHQQPDHADHRSYVTASVHEMIVGGSDDAQLALALRRSVGTAIVLRDLERYGFGPDSSALADETFWAELPQGWRPRMLPVRGYTSLSPATTNTDWANALSLGENNFYVTGLQVSRLLQAIGNGGVMITPFIRHQQTERSEQTPPPLPHRQFVRVMEQSTALKLQSAMRDTVQRGTAKAIAAALARSNWQIGGKTGTGPGPGPIGPNSDGWFAGLIFDPEGNARFTVATFLKHAGPGGGNPAKVSAELARYLIGDESEKPL